MRICIIGMGPYPTEEKSVITAPAVRLRLFAEPFIQKRYEVVIIQLEDQVRHNIPVAGAHSATAVTPEIILDPEKLRQLVDLSFVGAVFGVGSLMPTTAACRLATALDLPCWVDFNGDPMTELHAAQLRQGGRPDTVMRDHVWKLMRESLLRGDAFSTVSGAQRYALMGQLGILGRYINDWDISQRLHDIPVCVPTEWSKPTPLPPFPEILREFNLNESSRYILFNGSWNVWLDEVAMGKALAAALSADPDLYLVTGGIPTGPAGEHIKTIVMKAVAEFHEAGRVIDLPAPDFEQETALLAHAGTCITLERAIPESELGARNRLLPMVRWGCRPVISVEAEVETVVVAQGLASGIPEGDWERAARELLLVTRRTADQREEDRRLGREWLATVSFEKVGAPAHRWIAAGAPRWPANPMDGLLDRWANFPADAEHLFPTQENKSPWFFF